MNKKLFYTFLFLLLFSPAIIFAQKILPTQASQEPVTNKDYRIGLKYGKGITYTSGTIGGDGGQKALFGESESFAFQLFYNFMPSNHWLNFSIGKTEKELKTESNYSTIGTKKNYYYTQFINFSIGYTYMTKYSYLGLGIFYGLPAGSWFKKEHTSSIEENTIGAECSGYELGLSLNGGFILPVNDLLSIQIGAEINLSFTPSYKYEKDELKSNTLEFTTGFTYKI